MGAIFVLARHSLNQLVPNGTNLVRIPNEAVGELVLQRRVQEYCPLGKIRLSLICDYLDKLTILLYNNLEISQKDGQYEKAY